MPSLPSTPPPTPIREVLAAELTLLVARLRDFSPGRYAAPAPPFPSRAAAMWHLAGYLVAATGSGRALPALPDMALADVLAVTGHDLCTARPADPPAAAALAEVLLHRYEIDGAPPGRRSSAAALASVEPSSPASPERLLTVARRRCPAYG